MFTTREGSDASSASTATYSSGGNNAVSPMFSDSYIDSLGIHGGGGDDTIVVRAGESDGDGDGDGGGESPFTRGGGNRGSVYDGFGASSGDNCIDSTGSLQGFGHLDSSISSVQSSFGGFDDVSLRMRTSDDEASDEDGILDVDVDLLASVSSFDVSSISATLDPDTPVNRNPSDGGPLPRSASEWNQPAYAHDSTAISSLDPEVATAWLGDAEGNAATAATVFSVGRSHFSQTLTGQLYESSRTSPDITPSTSITTRTRTTSTTTTTNSPPLQSQSGGSRTPNNTGSVLTLGGSGTDASTSSSGHQQACAAAAAAAAAAAPPTVDITIEGDVSRSLAAATSATSLFKENNFLAVGDGNMRVASVRRRNPLAMTIKTVQWAEELQTVHATFSPAEYDRGSAEVDQELARAAWAVEEEVEKERMLQDRWSVIEHDNGGAPLQERLEHEAAAEVRAVEVRKVEQQNRKDRIKKKTKSKMAGKGQRQRRKSHDSPMLTAGLLAGSGVGNEEEDCDGDGGIVGDDDGGDSGIAGGDGGDHRESSSSSSSTVVAEPAAKQDSDADGDALAAINAELAGAVAAALSKQGNKRGRKGKGMRSPRGSKDSLLPDPAVTSSSTSPAPDAPTSGGVDADAGDSDVFVEALPAVRRPSRTAPLPPAINMQAGGEAAVVAVSVARVPLSPSRPAPKPPSNGDGQHTPIERRVSRTKARNSVKVGHAKRRSSIAILLEDAQESAAGAQELGTDVLLPVSMAPIELLSKTPARSAIKEIGPASDGDASPIPPEDSVWDMAVTERQAAIEANRLWGTAGWDSTRGAVKDRPIPEGAVPADGGRRGSTDSATSLNEYC